MKGFAKALGRIKEGDYGGALKSVQQQVKQVSYRAKRPQLP